MAIKASFNQARDHSLCCTWTHWLSTSNLVCFEMILYNYPHDQTEPKHLQVALPFSKRHDPDQEAGAGRIQYAGQDDMYRLLDKCWTVVPVVNIVEHKWRLYLSILKLSDFSAATPLSSPWGMISRFTSCPMSTGEYRSPPTPLQLWWTDPIAAAFVDEFWDSH